jgi:hypothetical protein
MTVILIIAFVVVSVYRYYQHINETNKAADLINQIKNINIAALAYRGINEDPYYIFKKLESQDVAPRDWEPHSVSQRWVTPRWGNFFIGGLAAGGYSVYAPPGIGNADGFLYTVSRIQKNICLKVIQGIEADFDFIALNNSDRIVLKNYNVPFSHTKAATECGNNGDRVWLGLMVYK